MYVFVDSHRCRLPTYLPLPPYIVLPQVTDKTKNPTRFVYFRDLAQQTVEQMNNCLKTLLEAYTLVRNNIETSGGYGLVIPRAPTHALRNLLDTSTFSVAIHIHTLET